MGRFTVGSRRSLCSSSLGPLLTADLCPRQAAREADTSQGHPSPDAGLFQRQQKEQEVRGVTCGCRRAQAPHAMAAVAEAPWKQD